MSGKILSLAKRLNRFSARIGSLIDDIRPRSMIVRDTRRENRREGFVSAIDKNFRAAASAQRSPTR